MGSSQQEKVVKCDAVPLVEGRTELPFLCVCVMNGFMLEIRQIAIKLHHQSLKLLLPFMEPGQVHGRIVDIRV